MNRDNPAVSHSAFASLRAGTKIALIALACLVAVPLQWLITRVTRGRTAFVVPRLWFGSIRRTLGIRAEVVGTPRDTGGTLFVGNHISHFDIVLLGSLLRARFIAKDDMQRWPGMRTLGSLGQTLFISRRRRDAATVAASIAAQMRADHDLLLFPEGTTSSGEQVAAFKSSLFSLFQRRGTQQPTWTLQPFTLVIQSVDGRALSDGGDRDGYAFHGDMDAGAHVQHFLRLSGAVVRVIFHAPMTIAPDVDRKALAAEVHAIVASGLQRRDTPA